MTAAEFHANASYRLCSGCGTTGPCVDVRPVPEFHDTNPEFVVPIPPPEVARPHCAVCCAMLGLMPFPAETSP